MDKQIFVDGVGYDLNVTNITLDTEFLYKYAERTEDFSLSYELGAIYLNQEITLGTEDEGNEDFVKLWKVLSSKSTIDNGTGHEVRILTPAGYLNCLMYPNSVNLNFQRYDSLHPKWKGLKVKFIMVNPYWS